MRPLDTLQAAFAGLAIGQFLLALLSLAAPLSFALVLLILSPSCLYIALMCGAFWLDRAEQNIRDVQGNPKQTSELRKIGRFFTGIIWIYDFYKTLQQTRKDSSNTVILVAAIATGIAGWLLPMPFLDGFLYAVALLLVYYLMHCTTQEQKRLFGVTEEKETTGGTEPETAPVAVSTATSTPSTTPRLALPPARPTPAAAQEPLQPAPAREPAPRRRARNIQVYSCPVCNSPRLGNPSVHTPFPMVECLNCLHIFDTPEIREVNPDEWPDVYLVPVSKGLKRDGRARVNLRNPLFIVLAAIGILGAAGYLIVEQSSAMPISEITQAITGNDRAEKPPSGWSQDRTYVTGCPVARFERPPHWTTQITGEKTGQGTYICGEAATWAKSEDFESVLIRAFSLRDERKRFSGNGSAFSEDAEEATYEFALEGMKGGLQESPHFYLSASQPKAAGNIGKWPAVAVDFIVNGNECGIRKVAMRSIYRVHPDWPKKRDAMILSHVYCEGEARHTETAMRIISSAKLTSP